MITKTKTLKINAGQITDVLASHLVAVGAIPRGWDVHTISSLIKHFSQSVNPNDGDYVFDVELVKLGKDD